jgi:hypothetical protein
VTDAPRPPRKDWLVPSCALAWAYPFLLVKSLYATWFVAWAVLGHRPVPSIDDPKSIAPVVDVPYLLTEILFTGLPIALTLGIVGTSWYALRRSTSSAAAARAVGGFAASWAAAAAFLMWDPLRVAYWFMD